MNKENSARIAVALFLAVLMIAGFAACGDYAVYPDAECARVYAVYEKLESLAKPLELSAQALWQAYIWLWFMAGVCALYALCRQTELNRPVSCLGALLAYLCPRFFAQGHYQAEMVLLTLVICMLWQGVRFLKKPGVVRGALLAAAIGLFVWFAQDVFKTMPAKNAPSMLWMMIVSLPLYVLPLAAAGQVAVCRRIWEQRRQALRNPVTLGLVAASLCWLIPVLLFARASNALAAGFVYAGVLLLAARGISGMYRFGKHFGGDCGMHLVLLAGLLLFFGWTARDIARNHPYQYVYYNRIGYETVEKQLMLDEENLCAADALRMLLETERNKRLSLTIAAWEDASQEGLKQAYDALEKAQKKQLRFSNKKKSPYLYSNTSYAQLEEAEPPEGYHELVRLESYGFTLCTIYEKDK